MHILYLRLFSKLSFAHIAEILDVSPSNAKQVVSRMSRKLSSHLTHATNAKDIMTLCAKVSSARPRHDRHAHWKTLLEEHRAHTKTPTHRLLGFAKLAIPIGVLGLIAVFFVGDFSYQPSTTPTAESDYSFLDHT